MRSDDQQRSYNTDEDDNQNNEIADSGRDMGDDGDLNEDESDAPGSSGYPADTDGLGEEGDGYGNTAGKYADQYDRTSAIATGEGDDGQGDAPATGNEAQADEHRNALGNLMDNLRGRGIDVDSLAEEAGVSSSDVGALEDDDVMSLSRYVAQNHPELTQQVYNRFPFAQSLLSRFLS